ncbi:G-protein coupled receptor Mth2-like [Cochliomyia hominivorax]
MLYFIYLAFLISQLLSRISPITAQEKCPFQNTVNLTNCEKYENGSYRYEDIIIPIEKQHYYNYDIKFLNTRDKVSRHLRGCVCEEKPCIKLCCKRDEYFNDNETINKCQTLLYEKKISWNLTIKLENGNSKVVNIFKYFTPQIGLPCPEPEAFNLTIDKYLMKEDGNLHFEKVPTILNTLDYCYSPIINDDYTEYTLIPFSCPTKYELPLEIIVNSYAMAVSVVFLIPTILVYLLLKDLRGNMHGKLVICYLFALTVGYIIISFINTSYKIIPNDICKYVGFTCYFFFMSAFLWLSVLCYDICRNFKETNIESRPKDNHQQFIIYSLYVWLSSTVATVIVIYVQLFTNVDPEWKPGIDDHSCWLNTKRWSAAIYFYGPNLLILLLNLGTFIHISRRIYKLRRNIAKSSNNEIIRHDNAIVICRLFLIMGISWIFDILSYSLRDYTERSFWPVDFFNGIQGFLIFLLFVMKKNVLNLLRRKKQNRISPNNCNTTTTNFSKIQSSTSIHGAAALARDASSRKIYVQRLESCNSIQN